MERMVDYQKYLINSLKNPEEAAGYLNSSLEAGDLNQFLLALRNVAQAQGSVSKLANKITKSRTSLYKTLSEEGNPYLRNTCEILNALGMKITIQPDHYNDGL
jgi:probable addiction module antidote protein